MTVAPDTTTTNAHPDVEAIIVGAGFGGLRMLHELNERGISARVLEAGSDVGGTWYWNRYPGARTDIEAWVYCYGFDRDLEQQWDWKERYTPQADVEKYLQHVADRFDLRKDIQLDTRVISAHFDVEHGLWTIRTGAGETLTCRYFITATGLLHFALEPPFKGLDSFQGETYLTARWPKESVDFTDKRVAVIGTGASGVQFIPVAAETASHLTVFQRTPNYVLPARNHGLDDGQRQVIKRDYQQIWETARNQVFGLPMPPAGRVAADVGPEEQQRILERGWETGGFRFVFETFDDLLGDHDSNALAAEFIRNKIRAIVKDRDTAELLCPKNHPLFGKRPPLGHFYYEAYNRDNVSLVDISHNDIVEITPTGIRLGNGEHHDVDMIVFALGFDAVTGPLTHMDCRGAHGETLKEKWDAGARTYLGVCVDDFPNFFMISGPQAPFANIPVVIESCVQFIGQAIARVREDDHLQMQPTLEAVDEWCQHLEELLGYAVAIQGGKDAHSWLLGANVPGKPRSVYFYFGGAAGYFQELAAVAADGFRGFAITKGQDIGITA